MGHGSTTLNWFRNWSVRDANIEPDPVEKRRPQMSCSYAHVGNQITEDDMIVFWIGFERKTS